MSDLITTTPDVQERRFVLGQLLRATILTTAAETDGRLDITDRVQPPGAMTPLHLHTRYEERLWVISGSMTVWAGSEKVTLRSGDFHVARINVPHMLQAGPEGCRALNISSPAGFAELIARAGTPAHLATPETALDNELFMAVTAELGDVMLAPPGTTPEDFARSQTTQHAPR